MTRRRARVGGVVVALLAGMSCSGGSDEPEIPPPLDTAPSEADEATGGAATRAGETFQVAEARSDTLVVKESPQRSAAEVRTLSAADEVSGKIVCLVAQDLADWIEVFLPSGPTGSTGWVERDDVRLSQHRFLVEVSRRDHTMTLYTGEEVALSAPVAIGPDAPGPGDRLYIKDLVQPPDPAGPYGPYAYGLSGSSNQRAAFAAGSGVVALHGTNDPAVLGTDTAYGAIGVDSEIVTRLVESVGLPLGTPVEITG
jgi:hypothetical protein